MGELILAASGEPRRLSIMLLDEPTDKERTLHKTVRKKREIEERSIAKETVVEVPPGKRVRILMTGEAKGERKVR